MSENRALTVPAARTSGGSLSKRFPDAVRGLLAGISANGEPLVDFCANTSGAPVAAASTVAVQKADIGREAILLFEDGDPGRPILVGLVQSSLVTGNKDKTVHVEVDGQRLTLSADQEIVLRCGEASITLTRAGKVLIRGTYLLSRSSGPNRIKGGSVHLN